MVVVTGFALAPRTAWAQSISSSGAIDDLFSFFALLALAFWIAVSGSSTVYLLHRHRKERPSTAEDRALRVGWSSHYPFVARVAGAWLVPLVTGGIAVLAALFVVLAYNPSVPVLLLFPVAVLLLQLVYLRLVR
jgi:hypothetical protein